VIPDEGLLVIVFDGSPRSSRECSWVCAGEDCLARLTTSAEEEGCAILQPTGVFDTEPRPNGRPSWVLWISKARARNEAEASRIFEAIYQPFTHTAR
jgi:hypothetical protein